MAKKVYNKDTGWSWKYAKEHERVRNITFSVHENIIDLIDEWSHEGIIRSRSEFLRQCVYDKILDYNRMIDLCNNHPIVVKNRSPPLGNCFRPKVVVSLVDNPNIYNAEEEISK